MCSQEQRRLCRNWTGRSLSRTSAAKTTPACHRFAFPISTFRFAQQPIMHQSNQRISLIPSALQPNPSKSNQIKVKNSSATRPQRRVTANYGGKRTTWAPLQPLNSLTLQPSRNAESNKIKLNQGYFFHLDPGNPRE